MYGIQRIHLLRNVMILAGAGVGGGSLNYANTLYVPPEPFFNDPQWKHITDWRAELMPHYDQAQRMLGVVENPTFTDADRIMKEVADDMGVGDTFVPTPVGVFFGPDGTKTPGKTVPDPYFGGAGPTRTGCIECGSCMTGCRYGAKNTLLKNYLGLAEKAGAEVIPMTTVTGFEQRSDGLWEVRTARTGSWLLRKRRKITATHVVLAAGTWGTQKLLFKMRDKGKLPKLSDKLGVLTRTNSESIVGAGRFEVSPDLDLTHGVAITSSIHPTSDTHVEPVRYGKGSNAMGLLQTLMTDGAGPQGSDVPRWRQFFQQAGSDPRKLLRLLNPRRWSERTMIALVMQHLDNSITTFTERTKFGFRRMTASRATASRTRRGSRRATRSPAASPRRSTASRAARGVSCSTSRSPRISSAAPRSATAPNTASSTRISACTTTRRCRCTTARRSRRISVSIRRCRSPRRPSGRRRCGPTRVRWTSGRRRASRTSALRRYRRSTPWCPPTRRRRCDNCRSSRSAPLVRTPSVRVPTCGADHVPRGVIGTVGIGWPICAGLLRSRWSMPPSPPRRRVVAGRTGHRRS